MSTHTKEHYSAIEKNSILLFATTWMDLEGIMLSSPSQRKTNTVGNHLFVESKNYNKQMNKKLKQYV